MQPNILKFITLKDYLNEKYTKTNLNIISDFYPEYYEDSKNNTEMVGWSSKHDQYKRFEILLNIGFKNGDSILDFGCGLGDLYKYLKHNYDSFKYIGVDINEQFIKKCKKKYPNILFKTINDISDIKYNYDWFIASGAFTVYTPIKNMLETIKTAFEQANYGVAVNFLEFTYAKNSDLEAIRGYNKQKLYKIFSNEFQHVELIDNYLEYDFTIYIKNKNNLN